MSRFTFFGTENTNIPEKVEVIDVQPLNNNILFKEGEAKYRSVQLAVIKMNGIIENHVETKLEYHVKKYINNGQLMVRVTLADQIVAIQPSYLQENLDLMSKIDVIKSNALVVVSPETGRILRIDNMDEIKANWLAFKNEVMSSTSFVKSSEMRANIDTFLVNVEQQMTEENILLDFQVRPFFDLFFDNYLVNDQFIMKPFTKLYYSQLFDRLPVDFKVTEEIVDETPTSISILKDGRLVEGNPHLVDFEKIYDSRYKPSIGYKFSGYDYNHETRVIYDLNENMLSDANMVITEEVKNNIELFVDYKLQRIE